MKEILSSEFKEGERAVSKSERLMRNQNPQTDGQWSPRSHLNPIHEPFESNFDDESDDANENVMNQSNLNEGGHYSDKEERENTKILTRPMQARQSSPKSKLYESNASSPTGSHARKSDPFDFSASAGDKSPNQEHEKQFISTRPGSITVDPKSPRMSPILPPNDAFGVIRSPTAQFVGHVLSPSPLRCTDKSQSSGSLASDLLDSPPRSAKNPYESTGPGLGLSIGFQRPEGRNLLNWQNSGDLCMKMSNSKPKVYRRSRTESDLPQVPSNVYSMPSPPSKPYPPNGAREGGFRQGRARLSTMENVPFQSKDRGIVKTEPGLLRRDSQSSGNIGAYGFEDHQAEGTAVFYGNGSSFNFPHDSPSTTSNKIRLQRGSRQNLPRFDVVDDMKSHQTQKFQPEWVRIGDLIGKGSFGSVHRGLYTRNGEQIAVKQLFIHDDERLRLSNSEVEVMQSLSHENIVNYFGVIREETTIKLYMEFVSGGSISSLVKNFGALPDNLISKYTRQILKGLAYLHSQNVIHRDIKGANVLVTVNGVVKIADFGCAKRLDLLSKQEVDATLQNVRGSVAWMAPEVANQTGHTIAADIWSLGATVLEMASGKRPWPAEDTALKVYMLVANTKGPPPIPESVSMTARDFIESTMIVDPEKRPRASDLLNRHFI